MAIKLRIAFRKQTQLSKVIEVQYMYYLLLKKNSKMIYFLYTMLPITKPREIKRFFFCDQIKFYKVICFLIEFNFKEFFFTS